MIIKLRILNLFLCTYLNIGFYLGSINIDDQGGTILNYIDTDFELSPAHAGQSGHDHQSLVHLDHDDEEQEPIFIHDSDQSVLQVQETSRYISINCNKSLLILCIF